VISDDEVQRIAAAVAGELQSSILKLPADVTEHLKEFAGWTYFTPISGHTLPYKLETKIMSDGGLHLSLINCNGELRWDRILSP